MIISAEVRSVPHEREPTIRAIHIVVLSLCLLVNILDGYDLLAIAYTSSRIMAAWHISPGRFGLVISAGLVGAGLGSLTLAQFADRYGRRPTVIAGLVMVSVGMGAVGFTSSPLQLSALRFLTGLGIGLLLPSINTLVSEYMPYRWRSLGVAIYASGYTVGAALAGALAPWLTAHWRWPSVFVVGSAMSLLLIPAVLRLLPESLEFLLLQGTAKAQVDAAKIATRLGMMVRPTYVHQRKRAPATNLFDVLRAPFLHRTCLISAAFALLWANLFFIINWLPAILAREGFESGAAARGGVALTVGGIAGTLLMGVFSIRVPVARLSAVFLLAAFGFVMTFAFTSGQVTFCYAIAAAMGFLMYGSVVGLYALAAAILQDFLCWGPPSFLG